MTPRSPSRRHTLVLVLLVLPLMGSVSLGGASCAGCAGALIAAPLGVAVDGVRHGVFGADDLWADDIISAGYQTGEALGGRSLAAQVDCSGVADEFDALYRGDVLADPAAHLPVQRGVLDRPTFDGLARGALRLSGDRAGDAIAVVHTSEGRFAKLLVRFDAPGAGDGVLSFRDLEVVDASGAVVRRIAGPVDLPVGVALDFDSATQTGPAEQGWDVAVAKGKGGEPALVEVRPASLFVAQQSLCLPSGGSGSAR